MQHDFFPLSVAQVIKSACVLFETSPPTRPRGRRRTVWPAFLILIRDNAGVSCSPTHLSSRFTLEEASEHSARFNRQREPRNNCFSDKRDARIEGENRVEFSRFLVSGLIWISDNPRLTWRRIFPIYSLFYRNKNKNTMFVIYESK